MPEDQRPKTTREAYSFACLSCGYGWEQEYAIEHRADAEGRPCVVYRENGQEVPSPLTHPRCRNCGGDRVRVMRPGLVAAVRRAERLPGQQP